MSSKSTEQQAKQSAVSVLRIWGESPVPPTLLATLVTSLHARPFQALPMLFPPILLASTFLNIYSYTTDSAGITASWSGLYLILARRRKAEGVMQKFGTRGLVRGAAVGVAAVNLAAGGLVYVTGEKECVG